MSELLKIFEFTAEQTRQLAESQSVTGDVMVIDGVTVIPVYKLSCGFAGGGTDWTGKKKSDNLTAGAGAKVSKTPLSFLALRDGQVQMLHVAREQAEKLGLAETLSPLVALFKEKTQKNGAAK